MAETNVKKSVEGKELLETGRVKFVKGDGRLGWAEGGKYDAIHVGAAAKEMHESLVDQLKAPGRLFIPVESGYMQHIYVVDKNSDGEVKQEKLYGVQYVPLTDAPSD